MGQSFELLPVQERIQQYREMADATFLKAKRTEDPVVRAQYMTMATNWHALAQQLEAGHPDPELSSIASQGGGTGREPRQA
jgi:hypothetical protein